MRVLITGADGFIGSHLAETLLAQGYRVRALSYYNSFNNWGWLEDVPKHENLEVVTGDVRDSFLCDQICAGQDIVFHLAALIAIPYSYRAPQSYVDTNITGTMNICQAALKHIVKRVIHTSTSEVYGSARYVPIDEAHPMQPQSPYSASKIGADAMALSFFHAFNLPLVVARPFNTFGPRQSARAILPTVISQIAAGRELVKVGDTSPTRDFNYVSDTVNGMLALAKTQGIEGETFNIGSGREISIEKVIQLIAELMEKKIVVESEAARLRPAGSEVARLCCNSQKLEERAGFKPQVSLEDGLRKTIKWFTQKENLEKYKVDLYNV